MTEPVKIVGAYRVEWQLDGKPHREDGPARVWNNGDQEWFHYGKRHREDGPAIEYDDISRELLWCLFGISFTKEEFWKRVYHD